VCATCPQQYVNVSGFICYLVFTIRSFHWFLDLCDSNVGVYAHAQWTKYPKHSLVSPSMAYCVYILTYFFRLIVFTVYHWLHACSQVHERTNKMEVEQ